MEFDYRYYDRFGCLYRLDQAFEAVPEGWRLPTDEDWQKLERHFGMSADEAAGLDWRGNVGGLMKTESDDYSTSVSMKSIISLFMFFVLDLNALG